MKILVLNDDGIDSKGLEACVSALFGNEVFVVAPDSEMSAISGALTLRRPIAYRRVEFPGADNAFSCDGTPVDCAKLALGNLMTEKPDVVVSGFNRGFNVGQDVFYSGTIAAAMEGLYVGIPSIAVSMHRSSEQSTANAKAILPKLIEMILEWSGRYHYFLSVNVPDGIDPQIVVTAHGKASFSYWYEHHGGSGNECWLRGEPTNNDPYDHTDASAIADGCVSVAPLRPSLSDNFADARPLLAELAGLVNKYFPVLP